ncbi:MAG: orotate phosphoribosyltransferase [Hymenobacteraceae bacterium]|nr:orotate phosphoribosyltransferase [Hymenobacteraceae bacterium]
MPPLVSLADAATARRVAGWLLDSEAVRLRPNAPFTWSSGWRSPIYCDNRVTLAFPEIRTGIADALTAAARQHFPGAEAIAGVATAGIAQGCLLADRLGCPYSYVRPQPKTHGMGNQIEGRILPGQRVVLVEDLVSTGGSSLKAAEALRAAGAEVVGMLAVFTYGFAQAARAFAAAGIPLVCLSDYAALLTEAQARGVIGEAELAHLRAWRERPEAWGK